MATLIGSLKNVYDKTTDLAKRSEEYSLGFSKGLTNVVKKTGEFRDAMTRSQEAINDAMTKGGTKVVNFYEKAYRQIEQAKIRSLRAEEKATLRYEKVEEDVAKKIRAARIEMNKVLLVNTKATYEQIARAANTFDKVETRLNKKREEAEKALSRKKLQIVYDFNKKVIDIETSTFEKSKKVIDEEADRMKKAADRSKTAFLDAADKIGTSLTSVGRTMAIVGAAMQAVLAIPVKFAYDVEKAMGVVRAVTRASGDEMARLNEKVKELGRQTIFTATQAAEGMQDLARAGFETTEIIGAMRNVLDLAASAQLSVAESAKISANIMRGYSLTVKDLADVNDVLVTAFTKSTTNLSELGVAFRYAGPLARAAGYDIKETGAILAAFANVGQQGTIAGTALRNALTRLANPTREAKVVLDSLGISVVDNEGKLKSFVDIIKSFEIGLSNVGGEANKTGILFEIFGQRAGPAMAAILGQGSSELERMYKNFEDIKGVTGDVAKDQLNNLYGAFVKLKSAAAGFLIEIGEPFLGILAKVALFFRKVVANVTEFISSLEKTTSIMIGGIAVFGALLTLVGGVSLAVGSLITTYALLNRTLQQFSVQAEITTAQMTKMGAAASANAVASGAMATTWQSKVLAGGKSLLKIFGVVSIAIAGFAILMSELDKHTYKTGETMKDRLTGAAIGVLEVIIKLKDSFLGVIQGIRPLTDLFKTLTGSFKIGKKAADEYVEAIRAAIQGEKYYTSKIPEFLAKAREKLSINLDEIKTIEDLNKERDDALKNYDYFVEAELNLLRKKVEQGKITKDELEKQEKELKEARVAYLEEVKNRTIEINAELAGGMGNLYENLLATIEKGSKEWFTLESQTIDALKSKNANMFEERKRLYSEGLISSKDFNEKTLKDLEEVYERERRLLIERIKQKKLLNAEDAVELKKLKTELIELERNYNDEVAKIQREGIDNRIEEQKREFDSWKSLQESRLDVVTKERDLELTQLKIAQDKGLISEENYLRKKLEFSKKNNEEKLRLFERTAEEELAKNEEKLNYLYQQEDKKQKEIQEIQEERVASTQAIRNRISTLENEGNTRDVNNLKKLLSEYERGYQEREANIKASIDKIQEKKEAIAAEEEKINNERIIKEKEVEEEYIQAEENIRKAQERRAEENKKRIKEEGEAVEELNKAQYANWEAIVEGIIQYRKLSETARETTGIASELVNTFDRFSSTLVIGGAEARALKAAMSGNAEEMIRVAQSMESVSRAAKYLGEDHGALLRALEMATAAQQLREEASRRMAMADREAALAIEKLTIATQEYLNIATSAQSAISTFSSNIEDLLFGLENGLINQSAFNEAIADMTERLKIAVPEGSNLFRSIINLLNALKSGKITIDFFTSALSEMTKAGFDASEGMEALADELAGHSVTTAAESAAHYIGIFSNALARGNEIVYRGIRGLGQYSRSVSETMVDASEKIGGLVSKIGSIPKSIPKISFDGISDTLTNLSKIRIATPRVALAEGTTGNIGDTRVKIEANINSLLPEEAERFTKQYILPTVFKALENKGVKVR